MSEFEKALEEKSKDFILNYINSKSDTFLALGITSPHAMRKDFKSGAYWAREFTVREIIKLLKIKDSIWCDCIEDIESHFKDRGGEK